MSNKFKPEICACCGQSTTYELALDRGTTDIMKALAVAIKRKGYNCIHPRKEMETHDSISYGTMVQSGMLTSNQVGNLTRARAHGLITKVKDEPGNWCLTAKGIGFLRGEEVPKIAVMSKKEKRQVGYFLPEIEKCTINNFKPDQEYWEGMNYTIREGRVILDMPVQKRLI